MCLKVLWSKEKLLIIFFFLSTILEYFTEP